MSTFANVKRGDRILYHDRGSPTHRHIGKKGVVIEVRNNSRTAIVIFDDDSHSTQVSTANIEVFPEIKVGDMVWIRVDKSRGGSCRCDKTRPHKITGTYNKWFIVDMNYYALEDLELATMTTEIEKAIALLKQHGTVTFVPKFKPVAVYLNEEHNAVVHEDYVKVGCQTIKFDRVLALAEVVTKVKNERK